MRLKSPTYVKPRELEEYEYIFGGMYLRKVAVKIRRVSSQQNIWSKTSPIYVLLGEHFFYIFWKVLIAKVHTNIKSFEETWPN